MRRSPGGMDKSEQAQHDASHVFTRGYNQAGGKVREGWIHLCGKALKCPQIQKIMALKLMIDLENIIFTFNYK